MQNIGKKYKKKQKIMKWYKVSYDNKITEVEVEKETDKCVYVKGNRNNKIGNYECYYPTFQEAHDVVLKKLENRLSNTKHILEGLEKELTKFKEEYGHIK